MEPRLRRLTPFPADDITVTDAYDVDRAAPAGRPWVTVGMIASVDGAIAIDGRSGALGNATDRAVLLTLRRLADVIIVGARTAAAENYGPPSKPGQRIGLLTNTGNIDTSIPLVASGRAFVVAPEAAQVPEGLDVIRAGDTRLDIRSAVAQIPDLVDGATFVSAEGGPTINGALLTADLIDEFCITTAPFLVGGTSPRLVLGGTPPADNRLRLAHLLADDEGYLFSRWVRHRAC